MAKNERKTKTKRAILVVIALLLVAYLISSTYARYLAEGKAKGEVNIAKWAVTMKANGETVLSSTEVKDITFTLQSNSNVVTGKIAPTVTAKAEVELDLTGTEVSVDVTPTIGPCAVFQGNNQIALKAEVEGITATDGTAYIPLVGDSAFTAANGKKKVILTLTWTNSDANNAADTAIGMLADGSRTITIPVTLTVQQHIES